MVEGPVPNNKADVEDQLVKSLETHNETLQNINLHFLDIHERFKICMVHEAIKSELKGTKAFIVEHISASPLLPDVQYFGIEASHLAMSKFESEISPGYRNISTTIKSWAQESPQIIQGRINLENSYRQQRREAQASEILNIYLVYVGIMVIEGDLININVIHQPNPQTLTNFSKRGTSNGNPAPDGHIANLLLHLAGEEPHF